MKKVFLFLLSFIVVHFCQAQLVVDITGKVAIGDNIIDENEETATPLSDFSVNSVGNTNACAHIYSLGKTYGLYINKASQTGGEYPAKGAPNYDQYGIFVNTSPCVGGHNYGVYGKSYSTGQLGSNSYAYGLYGIAGNCTLGRNYGVFGCLYGSGNGAAIYGTSSSQSNGCNLMNRYAGYFEGNVHATGTFSSPSMVTPVEYSLCEDIEELKGGVLEAIDKMNVVQFKYKHSDIEDGKTNNGDYNTNPIANSHFGIMAQELKEIYPDLVVENVEGYLAVNYIELVPILIQSIKELRAELKSEQKSKAMHSNQLSGIDIAINGDEVALSQNKPNPFTETTVIACMIPMSVKKAILNVYDLNGTQITEYPISTRGHVDVTIEGGSLAAGMYLYSLITDGNVIDTKRMILTK